MAAILVTGGNRGIGRQLCRDLVSQNRAVILVARTQAKADEARQAILKELPEAQPERLATMAADVAKPAELMALARQLKGKPLAALVNNAAILDKHAWDPAAFEAHLATNLRGPVLLARLLLPSLKAGHGRIVNVSTGLATFSSQPAVYRDMITSAATVDELMNLPFIAEAAAGGGDYLCYKISKAAVNRATQLLAANPEYQGIPVVSTCPGWVKTDMGGPQAPRTVEQGAASILAMLKPEQPPQSGIFTRDGRKVGF